MKILFISTTDDSKRNTGKGVVIEGMISILQSIDGVQFKTLCIGDGCDQQTKYISAPKLGRVLLNAVVPRRASRRLSLQECFYFSPSISRKILEEIDEHKPQVVLFDTLRSGQYVDQVKAHCTAKLLLYMDDLYSLRYERMINASRNSKTTIGAIGNFIKNLPAPLALLVSKAAFIEKAALKLEAKLIKNAESMATERFDRVFLIGSHEVKLLQGRSDHPHKVFEFPPYVKTQGEYTERKTSFTNPRFVFVGGLTLPHNKAAVDFIVYQLIPLIEKKGENFSFDIIGRCDEALATTYVTEGRGRVRMLGMVADLAPLFNESCALVAPIPFGSGVKLKIIDALSFAIPVLTTEIGREGIDIGHKEHGFICETPEEFLEAMRLVVDSATNIEFSSNCFELYRKKYSYQAIKRIYKSLILD